MSSKDFKTLLSILRDFPFSFTINRDKDKEPVVLVTYGEDKKGNFKLPIQSLDPKHQREFLTTLKTSKNRVFGDVPDSILKGIRDEKPEEKLYTVTKDVVYCDRKTRRVLTGEIDLSNPDLIKGKVVVTDHLPDLVFLYFHKPNKTDSGIGLMESGIVFSGNTPEWRDKGGDPMNHLINKILSMGVDKFNKMVEGMVKDVNKTNPVQNPTLTPKPKETTPEPLTRKTVKRVYKDIEKLIKGDDLNIYYSWEPGKFTHQWDGKNLVTVQFSVSGFLHTGLVSVTKDHKKGVYSVSLLSGEKPGTVKRLINGVPGSQLQDTIDRAVEFDGNQEKYSKKVTEFYKEQPIKKQSKKAA